MSDLDELKLRYTEENPDEPSDDVETIAFHSTPHKPKPAPRAVKPRKAKAEPPGAAEKGGAADHGTVPWRADAERGVRRALADRACACRHPRRHARGR